MKRRIKAYGVKYWLWIAYNTEDHMLYAGIKMNLEKLAGKTEFKPWLSN